jgi:hypothetical protein
VVYGASHRAGQLGEAGPPRPFCTAQSRLIPALKPDWSLNVPLTDPRMPGASATTLSGFCSEVPSSTASTASRTSPACRSPATTSCIVQHSQQHGQQHGQQRSQQQSQPHSQAAQSAPRPPDVAQQPHHSLCKHIIHCAKKVIIKKSTLPRFFVTRGGSGFDAYQLLLPLD